MRQIANPLHRMSGGKAVTDVVGDIWQDILTTISYDDISANMLRHRIISVEQHELIKESLPNSEKMNRFLGFLQSKTVNDFVLFVDTLEETGYGQIAERIRTKMEPDD